MKTHFIKILSVRTWDHGSCKVSNIGHQNRLLTSYPEYLKALEGLGDVRTGHPMGLLEEEKAQSAGYFIFHRILTDMPMVRSNLFRLKQSHLFQVYCALCVMFLPRRFSIASIAMLQQSAHSLRCSIENIIEMSERFRRDISNVKQLYEGENVVNLVKDGTIAYPSDDEKSTTSGMALDLRYARTLRN